MHESATEVFFTTKKINTCKICARDEIFDFYVNKETEDEFCINGYRKNIYFTVLFYVLGFISAGLVVLLGYWYPIRKAKFTHDRSCFRDATLMLIRETHGNQYYVSAVVEIIQSNVEKNSELSSFELGILSGKCIRYFNHKFLRYYFNADCNNVTEMSGLDMSLTVNSIYKLSHGITEQSRITKLLLHDENLINVPVRPFMLIFLQLALNPFYVFQVLSVGSWYAGNYEFYATVILAMTIISLSLSTYQTYSHLHKLHDMVGNAKDVKILEATPDGTEVVVKSSRDLVPGDVIIIPPKGMTLTCDAVLLNGRCIVNESTLTGESFPTTKTALDGMASSDDATHELYSVNKHKRHTLYNGTEILQAHFYGGDARILAVVMRTGFCTLKGSLIRSILHPKAIHFSFFRDSIRFICFLFFLAFLGFIYSFVMAVKHGDSAWKIVKKSTDVLTVAVPPALPACMSVGLMYALHRLKKSSIYCIEPLRVNLCGKIKLFVFDKTGTLTEDFLAVSGLVRRSQIETGKIDQNVDEIQEDEMVKAMACCHGLTIIDNELTGDPLDMYMFNFTKWKLHEPTDKFGSKFELLSPVTVSPPAFSHRRSYAVDETSDLNSNVTAILKQYPFESALQRMCVITKQLDHDNMVAYVKGSPEMIFSMCKADTLPENVNRVLLDFAKTGSRVLAIASKQLAKTKWHQIKKLQRSEVEYELNFLGLIIFENILKDASSYTIRSLQAANIRTVMATGDNLYTATSVAKEVNIIKGHQKAIKVDIDEQNEIHYDLLEDSQYVHQMSPVHSNDTALTIDFEPLNYCLLLSGSTYMKVREHYPNLLPNVLLAGSVFARMSPDQKSTLVEDLKSIGYGVGMCGDGANDCGALKAAHAGIALSDTEASVAAPFTSKVFDISCVPRLLQEGRAALVTSFGIFKYMALYSFVQFMGVLILYSMRSNYSDFQYLYADLALNLVLCFTMIQSEANPKLTCKRPPGRLVHPIFIGGIFLQVLLQFCFQFGTVLYVRQMSWYKPPTEFTLHEDEVYYTCYDNAALMIISFFQYIWLSAICTAGRPYRIPLYLNWKYVIAFFLTTAFTTIITFYQAGPVQSLLLFAKFPSMSFCVSLFVLSLGNFYLSYVIEEVLLTSKFAKNFSRRIQGKTEPRNKYKHIHSCLQKDLDFPPVAGDRLHSTTVTEKFY